jgi:ATP-dependent Clp protease ATP-binding subunit ClpC
MLLQVMEEGQLTDARGRTVNFQNAIIVMTSNVGADTIKRNTALGFNLHRDDEITEQEAYDDMRKNVVEQLRRAFRPEFLNRVDATVVFRSLTKSEIKQIVELELNKVRARLLEHAITLEVNDKAQTWLADHGYDPEFGARPLRRLIQNEVEDVLSDGILSNKFQLASVVNVDVDEDGKLVMESETEAQQAEAPPA